MSNVGIQYSDLSGGTGTVTSYQDAETGSNRNMLYYFNPTSGGEAGYVFELGNLDVSLANAVDPSFAELIADLSGGFDAPATLEFDVSLSLFQGLFSVQIDSSDVNDISSEDVLFRVNTPGNNDYNDLSGVDGSYNEYISVGTFFQDISYSEATVKSGMVNSYYSQQQVKYDFVRHLAKTITGGYSSSDIFTNEEALVNGVSALDVSFGTGLNDIINSAAADGLHNIGTLGTYSGSYSNMYRAAHHLYNLNLQDDTSMNNPNSRVYRFLEDISWANTVTYQVSNGEVSVGPISIPLRFFPGDRIAVKLTYAPASDNFEGNNVSLTERSYKVFFRLIE